MIDQNIRFNYRYRDDGNYKTFGSVIFSNPNGLQPDNIKAKIISSLISEEFFVPKYWGIEKLSPKIAFEIDGDIVWHEFESVEETKENPDDKRTIDEFLELISQKKQTYP